MVALLDVVSLTPSLAGDSGLSMEMQNSVWIPFYIAVKGAEHKQNPRRYNPIPLNKFL